VQVVNLLYNDTQHNAVQNNDILHNDTKHKGFVYDTQHNNALHYAECHCAEYHYAECHNAECRYAECLCANNVTVLAVVHFSKYLFSAEFTRLKFVFQNCQKHIFLNPLT
jgi:hypothetical protein